MLYVENTNSIKEILFFAFIPIWKAYTKYSMKTAHLNKCLQNTFTDCKYDFVNVRERGKDTHPGHTRVLVRFHQK